MRVVGTGEPSLIFVHGYSCALEDWDRQLEALSKTFRCVALNLPGHGGSALPDTVSLEALAEAVNKVKDQVGGGRVVLIGHSMGCRVVMEAYRQSPIDVAGLVFVDGGKIGGDLDQAIAWMTDRIDRGGIDAMMAQSFDGMFFDNSDPEVRQHIVRRALSLDPAFRRELLLRIIRWDGEKNDDALKQIAVPVLALQSTYFGPDLKLAALQPGMTSPWLDLVAALVPKSKTEIVPDVGHFTMIEAAPAVNAALARFAAHCLATKEPDMRVTGTGEPTLIFVHGYACAGDDWDRQLDALSKDFRCVALDLPGHGGAALPGKASIEALAEAVNKVKDQVGGGKVILIGHSMGCRVVTEAYLQSPGNVAGLVFVDGSRITGELESSLAQMTAWIDRGGIDAMLTQSFDDMFLADSDPKIRERIVRRARGLDPAFCRELLVQLVRWDIGNGDDALKRVAIPVLALQSTYIGPDLMRAALQPGMASPWLDLVTSLVPKAETGLIPGVGHFSMIEAAPALNAEIAKFAAKLA